METFPVLLVLCEGNSPVTGEFTAQRLVTWTFGVFFDLRLNKQSSKQWWGWWVETPSRPLWRQCNDINLPIRSQYKEKCYLYNENLYTAIAISFLLRRSTVFFTGSTIRFYTIDYMILQCHWNDPAEYCWIYFLNYEITIEITVEPKQNRKNISVKPRVYA